MSFNDGGTMIYPITSTSELDTPILDFSHVFLDQVLIFHSLINSSLKYTLLAMCFIKYVQETLKLRCVDASLAIHEGGRAFLDMSVQRLYTSVRS